MIESFSLLVNRATCGVHLGLSSEKLVALLGQPTGTHRQGRRNVLLYHCAGVEAFWAFWFIAGSLLNSEFHGGACAAPTGFPGWFADVSGLDIDVEDLLAAGFAPTSEGDATICDGVAEGKFCQAIFFEMQSDRFVFGWAAEPDV
jgi:hypothetical protein